MKLALGILAGLAVTTWFSAAQAQSRTPWEQHDGLEVTAGNPLGLLPFSCAPVIHGDICEYDVATIPSSDDPGWGAAPNGETIGFSYFPSRVCNAPITCMAYGDFTYFQTFVDVPENVAVTTFTIAFSGMDDGSRVTLFNSAHPGGLVVPGSYVYLGGSGTADLGPYVLSGEQNRVVVTQVDDCCTENNLHSAVVVLNGEIVNTGCNSDAECDDGVACTQDICNPDGSCSNPPADADADGSNACEDCDDSDPSVYPGAPEVCDGKDNNCNAACDEDLYVAEVCATVQRGLFGEVADSDIGLSYPTWAAGDYPFTWTGYSADLHRTLTHFDTGFIPSGSIITSATASWYASWAEHHETVNARAILDPWSEATVTWSTAPAFDTGAVLGSFDWFGFGYKSVGVTDYVQGVVDGAIPDFGILLEADLDGSTPGNYQAYFASEASQERRPKLDVCYLPPCDAGCF